MKHASATHGWPPSLRVFQRGWLSSNNILLVDDEQAVLVDSGYVTHAAQTLQLLRHALGTRPLTRLINTHLHSDHCGGNAALQLAYGCRTTVPAGQGETVRNWDEHALAYDAMAQQCARFGCDDEYADGDLLHLGGLDWQAIGAPGHDSHALLLYCEREGILISGDALWEDGFGAIFPELDGVDAFTQQRAVLERIAALDVRTVIPGHGKPFNDVEAALTKARSRLDYLQADPRRNARHVLKVLVAFLLLERQRIALDALADTIAAARLLRAAADLLALSPRPLAEDIAQALVQAGVARREGEDLLNAR